MKFLIAELFKSLEKNNIKYAVLRNYESLPQQPADSDYFDLDLIVSSKDYENYLCTVKRVVSNHNACIVKKFDRSYVRHLRVVKLVNDQYMSVQLDAHIKGQGWHGYYYLHEDEILKERKKHNNIYVVSDFHKALINWLDKLLWGAYVKDKYKDDIQLIMQKHKNLLESFLKNILADHDVNDLIRIFTAGDLNDSIVYRDKLITGIRRWSCTKHSIKTLLWMADFYYKEFVLRINPPGLKVVFKNDSPLSYEIFNDLKKIVLGDSLYLDMNNKINSNDNGSRRMYTVLRKQGLVVIISKHLVDINVNKALKLTQDFTGKNKIIKYILSKYKMDVLFGIRSIYISN